MAKKKTAAKAKKKAALKKAMGVTSQRSLAKAIGASASTVSGWIARTDWPVKKRGPWSPADVEKIRAWRKWLQEDRSEKSASEIELNAPSRRQQVDVDLKFHRMRRAKIEADEAEGRVIDRALADLIPVSMASMFVQALDNLEHRLQQAMPGDAATKQRILRDNFDDVRRELAGQEALELKNLEDAVADKRAGRKKQRGRKGRTV